MITVTYTPYMQASIFSKWNDASDYGACIPIKNIEVDIDNCKATITVHPNYSSWLDIFPVECPPEEKDNPSIEYDGAILTLKGVTLDCVLESQEYYQVEDEVIIQANGYGFTYNGYVYNDSPDENGSWDYNGAWDFSISSGPAVLTKKEMSGKAQGKSTDTDIEDKSFIPLYIERWDDESELCKGVNSVVYIYGKPIKAGHVHIDYLPGRGPLCNMSFLADSIEIDLENLVERCLQPVPNTDRLINRPYSHIGYRLPIILEENECDYQYE